MVLTVRSTRVSSPSKPTAAPNCGGRVPVDMTPGPAPMCRALKKSTPHPSCQDQQLELVAAAPQRRPPTSMNCMRTSTMGGCRCTQRACERPGPKYGLQLWELDCSSRPEPELAGPAQRTSTILSMYCSWRISTTMGLCLCAMTGTSTTNDGLQLRRLHSLQS